MEQKGKMMANGDSPADRSKRPVQRHRLENSAEDQLKYFTDQRRRAARPKEKTLESPLQKDRPDPGEKEE
ncbi:hypothetical protein [Glutamicibacter sp. HZAU]|uniref:hypothetical protein n=1 Tax=Glutamicibacter sp. HZAU TaxID=2049891 RepID=UPI000FFB623F|nr:hypothetical protein [Glutamicibacter sp. HZAU]RWZ84234.1 hypothetical protein EKH49_06550 [Glutamicibacter sp. HZAU]